MPAASDPGAVSLPETFRPLGIRVMAIGVGIALFAVVAAIWAAFPQETQDKFTLLQRLTLVGFALVAVVAGYALARSRVVAREDGLVIVNGFRQRIHPWADVTGVTLRAGGPWAIIELRDGTTVGAMGIQGSDGGRAVAQVKRLRVILRSRSQA